MGSRKIVIKESVATNIAAIAWFIESKGLETTAIKYTDAIYDFLQKLADTRRTHALCKDKERVLLGFKCISYKKKYTVVFIETVEELIVCEFIPSKNIYW